MAPLADFLLEYVPLPHIPPYLTTFTPGKSPLSTFSEVVVALITYLVAIYGIRAYMTNLRPHNFTTLFQAHNIILSTGSLLLLVLMLEEIVPIWWKNGIFYAICDTAAWTDVS
jgi:fatty acid elongase 3